MVPWVVPGAPVADRSPLMYHYDMMEIKANPLRGATATRFVAWGAPGMVIPERFEAQIGGDELPFDVDMRCEVVCGRPVCRELRLVAREGGPPVTSRDLRAIPIGRLIAHAAAANAGTITALPDGSRAWEPRSGVVTVERDDVEAPRRGRGLPAPADQLYRTVARVYRDAAPSGRPVKAVEQHGNVSRSTAKRWIAEARRRGLLPEHEED